MAMMMTRCLGILSRPFVTLKNLRMSWDSYIDNLIAQTRRVDGVAHCDKACIIGLDGGGPWTSCTHPNALKLQGRKGQTLPNVLEIKVSLLFLLKVVCILREWATFL